MIGTAYGVVLNDRLERDALAATFVAAPYDRPPVAPVLYVKPRTCITSGGAAVVVPDDLDELELAATIALLFAADGIAAACLALEISAPHRDYYRPAIRERCRDGFLPLGDLAAAPPVIDEATIITAIDGEEVHRWSLDRLVRPVGALIDDVQAYMTLCPGDLLMVGLAGDAPRARAGQSVSVTMAGMPTLTTRLVAEQAA